MASPFRFERKMLILEIKVMPFHYELKYECF